MKLRTAAALIGLAAVAAGFADQLDLVDRLGGSPAQQNVGRVERVVDGDTIRVRIGEREETVRYIGIDTPETKKPGTPVQCFGPRASAENERLVEGERVRLVTGTEPRDRYGRLLAYVFDAQDGVFVNERMLSGGFARALTIAPNDRYEARFRLAEARARATRAGLWGQC